MSKRDPYGDRLTQLENWLDANRDSVLRACKAEKVRPTDLVSLLRTLVSRTNKTTGEVSESLQQLETATWINQAQVRRCLKALRACGALETVHEGRSSGRGGGQGLPAVRRVTFLTPVDNTPPEAERLRTTAGMTAHYSRNDRAPECAPPRGTSTETPHGLATEPVNTSDLRAVGLQGGTESKEGGTGDPWANRVLADAAAFWFSEDEQRGRARLVRDPKAVKRKKADQLRPCLEKLRDEGAPQIPPGTGAYTDLLLMLMCSATGEDCHSTTRQNVMGYQVRA